MKRFLFAWLYLFAVCMACLAMAFPVCWFIKWHPPMLSDIMNIGVLRIAVSMLVASMAGALFLTRHSRQCGAIGIGHPGVLTQRADVIGCQFAVIGGTGVLRGQNLVFDDLLVGGVHVRLRLVFPVRALRARIS